MAGPRRKLTQFCAMGSHDDESLSVPELSPVTLDRNRTECWGEYPYPLSKSLHYLMSAFLHSSLLLVLLGASVRAKQHCFFNYPFFTKRLRLGEGQSHRPSPFLRLALHTLPTLL